MPPKFAPDLSDEEADEADDGTEDTNDSVIMINGGQIQAREVKGNSPDVINKAGHRSRINNIANIEETKINFFDPTQYRDHGAGELYELEKDEEDQILEGKIDPLDWRKEIDRVYQDLDNIEREIELNK